MSTAIASPEVFFGHQMGTDRQIARWDRIVAYFQQLEGQSDKIKVIDLGPSTEDNPFLLVIISSSANLTRLEQLRAINLRLNDPRDLAEDQVEPLIQQGKAVICQSMSLHATEIGGTQMAPELAYELISSEDTATQRILDNVVFLMVPCFNPDGQIMVTDWYNRWLDTEYEGCSLPWLYHKYAGHDNNRDAFQTNLVESQYMADILFREWKPQAFLDHHHFGSYGPRFYVPPYCDPIHPHADPLIWREHSWYGAHIAYKLEEAGMAGVVNAATFSGWGHLGFHWIAAYHNIAGMLTESASAKLASPLYVHHNQLTGDRRETLPSYDAQTNFPHPWPGGWWRLRDIVQQQKISAWATLDLAARHRETVLRNAYLKARRQTEAGADGSPRAYVIPRDQHDRLTAARLIEKLLGQGIEIHAAHGALTCGDTHYQPGSYVISLAQPKSGVIKTLLGRTSYPDTMWTRTKDDEPLRPYDTATDTMAEFMGVRVDAVNEPLEGRLDIVAAPLLPAVRVASNAPYGYALDPRLNDSYAAVNRILTQGGEVYRSAESIETTGGELPPGTFAVFDAPLDLLRAVAEEAHVQAVPLSREVMDPRPVGRMRIGLYQGYLGGNADEGWTRLVLEQFGFPYQTCSDSDIEAGGLREKLDALILPSTPTKVLIGELEEWWEEHHPHWPLPVFPPEYRTGFGDEGTEAISAFVHQGGTLVTLDQACDFAIEKLGLKVRNTVKELDQQRFFCPGSTLRIRFDNRHPLALGMPEDALILFWNSPAFAVLPSPHNDHYAVVASYPERDLLHSGWLIGEEELQRKASLIEARCGDGKVVLVGFRAQHRAQTHGTYKVLFNSLLRQG
jgi:hypothetical protein